jgi:SOS-response transcriptional repressor LexA
VNVLAQEVFDEYICVASELLHDRDKARIVSIRAVGDSMQDAGINSGDYVLVEVTEAVSEGDLIVAIIDSFAVIKKLEFANNAVILRPVSTDPQYRPIILSKNFKIFGKVLDVIRMPQRGDIEVVPLVSEY